MIVTAQQPRSIEPLAKWVLLAGARLGPHCTSDLPGAGFKTVS